jgi:GDP-L-fucose synthase
MQSYDSSEPIILSVDEADEISIYEVVHIIATAMKFSGNIIFDETKADGQYKKTASNQKLRKILPEFEFTGIGEGIVNTCKWFEENYENARK